MTEQGLVTSVSARSVRVYVEGHGDVRCTLRGNLWATDRSETHPVAAGDRVEVKIEGDEGVIESVGERSNRLARPQPAGRSRSSRQRPVQVIAANLDRLIVVASLRDPPFRPGLVDRFLVAAAMQGVDAVLCVNKVDLADDRSVGAPWRETGTTVIETSAQTGEGIDALRAEMSRGLSLLIGHSGVGKSSLINAVSPVLGLAVGAVTEYHGRGRHTTTRVTLLPLESGGWVVDSPGIREFGLDRVPAAEFARLFPGFDDLPDDCRFTNCLHREEPGCAVREAVESAALSRERYEGYLRILAELTA